MCCALEGLVGAAGEDDGRYEIGISIGSGIWIDMRIR